MDIQIPSRKDNGFVLDRVEMLRMEEVWEDCK